MFILVRENLIFFPSLGPKLRQIIFSHAILKEFPFHFSLVSILIFLFSSGADFPQLLCDGFWPQLFNLELCPKTENIEGEKSVEELFQAKYSHNERG